MPDNPYRLLTAQNLHFIYQLIYNMKVQSRKLESILRPKKGAKITQMNLWLSCICSWGGTLNILTGNRSDVYPLIWYTT